MNVFNNFFTKIRLLVTQTSDNWIVSSVNVITVVCIIGSSAFLVFSYQKLPVQVPLWYSRPWGADQLAHPLWLGILPAGMVFWYCITYTLVIIQNNAYRIFSQTLFLASCVVTLLSTLTLVRIILLVT